MSNKVQPDTNVSGAGRSLPIELVVNGQAYQAEVNPTEIFHEALEHALPEGLLVGHRIRISTPQGDEVFPDMFIGESAAHFHTHTFHVEARPLSDVATNTGQRTWTNFGFDHLAITVADRADAKDFFSEVLGMTVVRDDRHLTVLTTGNVALFFFDAEKAPLSDGIPSQRWSLYCHYRNGDTRLMIQLSEIKPENRGFINPQHFSDHMYDYLSGRYGVRFEEEQNNQ